MGREELEKVHAANIRLTPEATEFLSKDEKAGAVTDRILSSARLLVTLLDIKEMLEEEEKVPVPTEVRRASGFKPLAKEYDSNFEVVSKSDVSGNSRSTGTVEDFVSYFNDRFKRTEKMLRERTGSQPTVKSTHIKGHEGDKVRFIGMVSEKSITRKGNLMVMMEDEHDVVRVIFSQNDKVHEHGVRLIPDEVVAVDGKIFKDMIIANEVTWPDVSVVRDQKFTENDVAIAYLSDLHFGSNTFMEKEFGKFVSWLNGNEGETELAGKVKYIIIAGDLVDGIGIYPNQEDELIVNDIYKQYEMFDRWAGEIPDYIEIIAGPGNHDAVRRAEPQPIIPEEMIHSRVTRIGSPAHVKIEGLKHLVYHGTSLDSIIAAIAGLDYAHPGTAMLELLKRRHLSPIYGENLIVPEGTDYMVIDEEPDILHMGHIHKNACTQYRGTMLVNSGTFQAQTDFQLRMGHIPTPCIVPIYESKPAKVTHLDFKKGGTFG